MPIVEAWFVQQVRRVKGRRGGNKAAKAGWYYDPRKLAKYRYWNGTSWTDETSAEIPR